VTWRIAIRHRSGYQYQRPVTSSYNEARISPISSDRQLVLEASVDISPRATTFRYWDWWGTLVHAFDVQVPHDELVVTGTSVEETSAPQPRPDRLATWEELATPGVRDRFAEFLNPTPNVPIDDYVMRCAEELAGSRDPLEACQQVVGWVRQQLRYERGTTTVSTKATDALRQGSGVCQDFAHVALALLRAVGIPSRYVSGYLHPNADADVGVTKAGQSHAWVDAWIGEWWPLDPTNGSEVGQRHVIVGRARDYSDVSPLSGIYHGGPAEALGVTVELTRLA
jgi:transglutaminase-like putative cysteine protease